MKSIFDDFRPTLPDFTYRPPQITFPNLSHEFTFTFEGSPEIFRPAKPAGWRAELSEKQRQVVKLVGEAVTAQGELLPEWPVCSVMADMAKLLDAADERERSRAVPADWRDQLNEAQRKRLIEAVDSQDVRDYLPLTDLVLALADQLDAVQEQGRTDKARIRELEDALAAATAADDEEDECEDEELEELEELACETLSSRSVVVNFNVTVDHKTRYADFSKVISLLEDHNLLPE